MGLGVIGGSGAGENALASYSDRKFVEYMRVELIKENLDRPNKAASGAWRYLESLISSPELCPCLATANIEFITLYGKLIPLILSIRKTTILIDYLLAQNGGSELWIPSLNAQSLP